MYNTIHFRLICFNLLACTHIGLIYKSALREARAFATTTIIYT